MRKQLLSFLIIWIFVVGIVTPIVAHDLYLYDADVYGVTTYIGRTPCSTLVYIYSISYVAINCQAPYQLISLSTTTPETVINAAIAALTTGGRLVIANGTYTFTTTPINLGGGDVGAIGSTTINNIDLSGFGNSTILKAGTNMNGDIIITNNVKGWHIHDLQINGNAASQSGSGSSPPFAGIAFYHTSNSTIDHVYAHNNKAYGLYSFGGSDLQFLNNYLTWNYANGIIMESNSSLIANNRINGASDVGISITATYSANHYLINDLVQNNIITNINLGISPFSVNSGIGIIIGDGGSASGVTVSGNIIASTSGPGIVVGGTSTPDFDISITGNVDTNSYVGLQASLVTNLIFNDNIINSTTKASAVAGEIYILSSVINGQFANNLLYSGPNLFVQGIYWSSAFPGLISGNQIIINCPGNGAYICVGIEIASTVSGMQILGNTINGAAGGSDGILDAGSMSYSLIANNILIGSASSSIAPDVWIISGHNNIFSNDIYYNFNGGVPYDSGYLNSYYDLQGTGSYWNYPVGHITNPILTGALWDYQGTSSTFVSGTTYTNYESPKILYISGGTITAISVDSQSLAITTPVIVLQPLDTFSITDAGGAATIVVFGI